MLARYYASGQARFLGVDPADDSSLDDPKRWNRYAYVANNPLILIDPSGAALVVSGTSSAKQQFEDTANSGLFGKEAKIDSSGNVTLAETGVQGPPTAEQAAFESSLSQVITDPATTSIGLVEGSSKTIIDSFPGQEIDMADVQAYGSGPGASAVGFLAHGVAEQYAKQVGGVSSFHAAHSGPGIAAENAATGYTRGPEQGQLVHNPQTGDISGRITVPYTKGSQVVNVTTTVRGGNVTKVDRK